MGWVEKKFADQSSYAKGVRRLWDAVRESVDQSIVEFNARVPGALSTLSDCAAPGKFCLRITKYLDNTALELSLDEVKWTFNKDPIGSEPKAVCGIRVTPDHSGLEFFTDHEPPGDQTLTIEQACKMALEDFLFGPEFPRYLDPPAA